ncbi:heat shock protein [hydrothermal vent metagenome]|uniref:Heat shock protein n=1 Tax=hydrothermal vent metagenome TaxID=652676 RepID=A0A1W1EC56_9ZZZZ
MTKTPQEEIDNALEVLGLPKLITKSDIKKQYRFLSKKYHPDIGGDAIKQEQLNLSYKFLMKYIEEFRYTFDEREVSNQFPGVSHANRFRP